ncbi:hypothetical protein K8R43_01350 [archaeon]|nr:hypothetical protein [archaeon]
MNGKEAFGVGLLILGLILLVVSPIYFALGEPDVPLVFKVGFPLFGIGFIVLLVSVFLDRLKEKEVERA